MSSLDFRVRSEVGAEVTHAGYPSPGGTFVALGRAPWDLRSLGRDVRTHTVNRPEWESPGTPLTTRTGMTVVTVQGLPPEV